MTKTVAVETQTGRQVVPCRFTSASGLLVVMPDLGDVSPKGKPVRSQRFKWTVTHVPTGTAVFRSCKSLKVVVEIVRELDDSGWQDIEKGNFVEDLPDPLQRKFLEVMDKYGYRLSRRRQSP